MNKRLDKIAEHLEDLSEFDRSFILWLLLKDYQEKIILPTEINSVEEFANYYLKNQIKNGCRDILELLSIELWGR